jgi:hypothetical protein
LTVATRRNPADVVAAEIEQHQMLGAFSSAKSSASSVLSRWVWCGRRAGKRPDGDGALAHPYQDFRTDPAMEKPSKSRK